ncbi:hypothetical protein TrLO_g6195 [Triparma laevis f. longispina]|nr:hypothetical protein TrLO_g6195 [Triparma laevis f. longispina]
MKNANLLKHAIRLYQVSIKGLLLGLELDYTLYKTYFAAMGGLANAYLDLEDFTKGLEIYSAILVLHEKKIGKEHANTMLACHNLGTCHKVKGGVQKALEFYERALDGRRKLHGDLHEDTLLSLFCIGLLYEECLCNYEKALEYHTMVRDGRVKMLGVDDKMPMESNMKVAFIYVKLLDFDKAITICRPTLQRFKRTLGVNDESTKRYAKQFVNTLFFKQKEVEVNHGCDTLSRGLFSEMKAITMMYDVTPDVIIPR